MYNSWKKDLDWSAKAFSELVWPILQTKIGGDLIHVEQITELSFAKDFDQLSGIDAWHIKNDRGIRGIASRVQVCPIKFNPYCTFTVRKSRDNSSHHTEYAKRKMAIQSKNGWLYPHLTVQAYLTKENDGDLRCFAVAKTIKIINEIDTGNCEIKRTVNAEFFVVRWTIELCSYIWSDDPKVS